VEKEDDLPKRGNAGSEQAGFERSRAGGVSYHLGGKEERSTTRGDGSVRQFVDEEQAKRWRQTDRRNQRFAQMAVPKEGNWNSRREKPPRSAFDADLAGAAATRENVNREIEVACESTAKIGR